MSCPATLKEAIGENQRVFVLTDKNVKRYYGDLVAGALDDANMLGGVLAMPAGERYKTDRQVIRFCKHLDESGAGRNDTIVALGGGVVGDLAGFASAIYRRGVKLVQAPTTVLAMVDSSVGGKTGANLDGKNLVGVFWQPDLIVADPTTLATLDQRVYTEGYGEVVKGSILDRRFLPALTRQAENLRQFSPDILPALGKVARRCINQKLRIVADDPREQKPKGGRRRLNYGHTLGHGLEAAAGLDENGNQVLFHGEAVAIGMMYAAQLAIRLGICEDESVVLNPQRRLLETFGLPTDYNDEIDIDEVLRLMNKDKKGAGEFVLPDKSGKMKVVKVEPGVVRSTVEEFLGSGSLSLAA